MKYTRKRRRRRKLRGGVGDTRHSFLPTPLSDLVNQLKYSMSHANTTLSGSYPGVNPNWRIQPLR